jgi:nucleotide-binding universal stress UspA family protein
MTATVAPEALRSVFVPLDGSAASERALPSAWQLAERLGADIHLYSAVSSQAMVAERTAELAAFDAPGRPMHRSVVVDRDPGAAIHEALGHLAAVMVCLAGEGKDRSAGPAASVLTQLGAQGHDAMVIGPMVDQAQPGHGVVACVDDPKEAAGLVSVALGWARFLEEPLVIITIAEPVPPPLGSAPPRRRFGPDGDVAAYLDGLVGTARDHGTTVETVAVFDAIDPGAGLTRFLRDRPAALVVVRRAARRHFGRLSLGTRLGTVLHRSPSPLLVLADT